MHTVNTIEQLRQYIGQWRSSGKRIGFVPTMGNLHEGHLALVREAAKRCDYVVVSIFVNPLQFNDQEDFTHYPRTESADAEKLAALKVDLLFLPDEQVLYPEGREEITRVEVPGLTTVLEGASRPGHFTGVTTVVNKLFNCVQPDVAMFGEKDFQQLLVVKRMVHDLNIPLEIIGMPTTREGDGLAMSSRNNRLNTQQRQTAAELYKILQQLRQKILTIDPVTEFRILEQETETALRELGFVPDYVAIRQDTDLQVLADKKSANDARLVILAAASLGDIRLIDNLRI